MPKRLLPVLGIAAALASVPGGAGGQFIYNRNLPPDHQAIRYAETPVNDPVSRLNRSLDTGTAELAFQDGVFGYLPSVLQHLGIDTDSQALVFSKTSLQFDAISPRNPRAIYFSDNVAVAFVRGGNVLELAALDPRQGVIFYTLGAEKTGRPRFQREQSCLRCHLGPATSGVPGLLITSVFPSSTGSPNAQGQAIVTDHRTLFEERWGGWYVSGTHGAQRHRGNAVALDPANPKTLETEGTQNLTDLVRKFDTKRHLTPHSDIVALMTFEHQTQMTNLLTRAGWQERLGEAPDVEELVRYMLFADEAPLKEEIQGVSTFAKTFPRRGPRDKRGRSLRDFDLKKRLFKYPLSYMIYSEAFDGLPETVRSRVHARLEEILTGRDQSGKFSHLSDDDRRTILEILRETKL